MLTYTFEQANGEPLYEYLYRCMKEDIVQGNLAPNQKLPSKRSFASHLGLSVITVEHAYGQLLCEGYIYSVQKKGYYVSDISEGARLGIIRMDPAPLFSKEADMDDGEPERITYIEDFSNNTIQVDSFPFSIWAKLTREVLSECKEQLLVKSPVAGIRELRKAIADHLYSFRGMKVSVEQIIVGAGTEYLYELLIQLLGRDKIYCVENPGYRKIVQIYKSNDVACVYADMDRQGITLQGLKNSGADIAHISPTHHFPTGITMPVSRRYELLTWANEEKNRYIIEDDYDSEFRLTGKPIPTMYSIDVSGKVIYMNTFSKSLSATMRISYMVLPQALAEEFYRRLGFYSCTVSNFEQYTLARFIEAGYFEKQINRMRLFYARQRKAVLATIKKSPLSEHCRIIEEDSGLHFLLELDTEKEDGQFVKELAEKQIHITALKEYYHDGSDGKPHTFILNYSNIQLERLDEALEIIQNCL